MTYAELLEIFRKEYPGIDISDFRPAVEMHIPKDRPGIVIWTKQGDVIVFFPEKKKKTRFEKITESPTSLAYFLLDVRFDVGHYKYDEYPPAADPEEMERWLNEECEWK